MLVSLCRLTLYVSHCHSLKEKRAVVRQLKDRVFKGQKVVIAEVGSQDKWQRIELGFAVVGSDRTVIERVTSKVLDHIEELALGRVAQVTKETVPFGDEHAEQPSLEQWIPDFAKEG